MALLEVQDLSVSFDTQRGRVTAVDRVSFSVDAGETLGIVGESGCGKSITSLALLGLLPSNARVSAKKLFFNGRDLSQLNERLYRQVRGQEISLIFQDPMTSLNPSFTVGFQIEEILSAHRGGRRKAHRSEAISLLERVGIPEPEARLQNYPHELSGGMAQRVMIAISIACRPKLLIADEPTTALDVTIQAQILELLRELQKEYGMALMLITHDLGVVAETADKLMVMYAGQLVESGKTSSILTEPQHPYTEGLLACLPARQPQSQAKSILPNIPGLVPDLLHRPRGCQLHPRCKYTDGRCKNEEPSYSPLGERWLRCHKPLTTGTGARV